MSAEVIHLECGQAPAACTSCGYEWRAVVPLLNGEHRGRLECPRCSLMAGVYDAVIDHGPEAA